MISINTAMKCVKQIMGKEPEVYAIVFLEHIENDVYDAIEYDFKSGRMNFGFINRG